MQNSRLNSFKEPEIKRKKKSYTLHILSVHCDVQITEMNFLQNTILIIYHQNES